MLTMLKKAWNFFKGETGSEEPWAVDEDAFANHFGEEYDNFADRVASLDRAHIELYEKTMEINPEAAVTWVFFITGND